MKKLYFIVGAVLAGSVWLLGASPSFACNSGPDYCTDDPRIQGLLEAKKKRLSAKYPARLVALLDIDPKCVARIEQSPDGFSIKEVKSNGDSLSVPWTMDAERISKTRLANGEIERFWLIHTARAFRCDGEPPHDQRTDWLASDGINTSFAIRCDANNLC